MCGCFCSGEYQYLGRDWEMKQHIAIFVSLLMVSPIARAANSSIVGKLIIDPPTLMAPGFA